MDNNYTRFLEETLREQIKTTSLVLERLHEAQAELETRTRERDLWKEKAESYRLESMMCSLHNIETSLDSIEASLSRLADAVCTIKECQSSVEMGNALKAISHLETPTEITVRKEE